MTTTEPPSDTPADPESPTKTITAPVPQSTGPDRFDQLAQVVRPRLLLVIGVIVAVIAVAILWACTATITDDVTLTAAVTPETYFTEVTAPVSGSVANTDVRSGDEVTSGEAIATVTAPGGEKTVVRSPVNAVVAAVYATEGSTVESMDALVVLAPTNEDRVITAFPTASSATEIQDGQSLVATVPGCAALITTVSHVGALPLTKQAATERVGEAGVVDAIMPTETGVPVTAKVPASWCPSLKAGAMATMTVTVGSAHPISYVSP